MKKLMILLYIGFVICVPELCYTEAAQPASTEQPPEESAEEIKRAVRLKSFRKDINTLRKDILLATEGMSKRKDIAGMETVEHSLHIASVFCLYLKELQYATLRLSAIDKGRYYFAGGIKALEYSRMEVESRLKIISIQYGYLESQAALRLADQAKAKLRSLLSVMDELIDYGKSMRSSFFDLYKK